MGRIAFIFSGQGDQFPGMGKALADQYPAAAAVFEQCDVIRPGTSAQCFCGTDEVLKETKNTQPCLIAMEMAAAAVLREAGIIPEAVAGFSLGEVAACTAAGIVDFGTGFRLVCKRGELMQRAAEKQDTAMAAVVKLTPDKVEELCGSFSEIYPVNYNCPGQITVAGLSSQMPDFSAAVKASGGRALPLKVKGAFHSPFMREASEAFASELSEISFLPGSAVLYSNVTAEPYTGNPANLLSSQICNPVRWESLIRNMIASGVDTFIEIGPGKTLTNMVRKIDGTVKTFSVAENLEELVEEVKTA